MKKFVLLLICLFPLISVEALSCYETSNESPLILEKIDNFSCMNIEGESLTFKNTVGDNTRDLKDYFTYNINEKKEATITISKELKFDSNFENGIVVISDGKSSYTLYVKNNAYVKPTEKPTSTTTTTTTSQNEITYTVVLDNKGVKEERKCNVKREGDTCNVTLPNLEVEGFKGWGSSNTCKDGKFGSTKVNKNETYYACYETNENTETKLYLKTLKVMDAKKEEIDFGTFSIKKQEYSFKVLNEVDKLEIEATADENVKVEYVGHDKLEVGENEVIIKLTDTNNVTNEYKLIVNRLKEGESIENINYLSALVIGNYNINFNKSVFNYNLLIDNDIYKLVINAVPLDEQHLIEIKNNNNLENGSVIQINVLDGEGTVTTYNINIIKESNNTLLFVAIGVILLLIIILVILIIIKKNQKKKLVKKDDKKTTTNESVEVLNI